MMNYPSTYPASSGDTQQNDTNQLPQQNPIPQPQNIVPMQYPQPQMMYPYQASPATFPYQKEQFQLQAHEPQVQSNQQLLQQPQQQQQQQSQSPQIIQPSRDINVIQAPSISYKAQQSQQQQGPFGQPTMGTNQGYNYPAQTRPPTQYGLNSNIGQFRTSTIYSGLPIRNNEVSSHYQNRKYVYENVLNALKNHDKAIAYSNIWCNMHYLGSRYPKSVEDTVCKYGPFLPSVLQPKTEKKESKDNQSTQK